MKGKFNFEKIIINLLRAKLLKVGDKFSFPSRCYKKEYLKIFKII